MGFGWGKVSSISRRTYGARAPARRANFSTFLSKVADWLQSITIHSICVYLAQVNYLELFTLLSRIPGFECRKVSSISSHTKLRPGPGLCANLGTYVWIVAGWPQSISIYSFCPKAARPNCPELFTKVSRIGGYRWE